MRNKGISFDNRGDKSSFGVGRAVSKIIEGYRSDNGNSGFDLFEIDLDAIANNVSLLAKKATLSAF